MHYTCTTKAGQRAPVVRHFRTRRVPAKEAVLSVKPLQWVQPRWIQHRATCTCTATNNRLCAGVKQSSKTDRAGSAVPLQNAVGMPEQVGWQTGKTAKRTRDGTNCQSQGSCKHRQTTAHTCADACCCGVGSWAGTQSPTDRVGAARCMQAATSAQRATIQFRTTRSPRSSVTKMRKRPAQPHALDAHLGSVQGGYSNVQGGCTARSDRQTTEGVPSTVRLASASDSAATWRKLAREFASAIPRACGPAGKGTPLAVFAVAECSRATGTYAYILPWVHTSYIHTT